MKPRNCNCFKLLLRGLIVSYCLFFSYTLSVGLVVLLTIGTLISSVSGAFLLCRLNRAKVRDLENSNQEMNAWMGNIAHDLMAPLGAIQGYAEILDEFIASNLHHDDPPPYAKAILDLGFRLEGMAKDLTDISRVKTKTIDKNLEIVSLMDMTRRVMSMYEIPGQNATPIHFSPPKSACLVRCRPQLVERAIQNLLQNADRYSPTGSKVLIKVFSTDQHTVLSVINQTNSPKCQSWAKLTKRYQRGPDNPVKGSGLGLSIVKEIMELHQGDTAIHQQDDQIIFTLRFPHAHAQHGPKSVGILL